MGTYALGAHLAEQDGRASSSSSEVEALIRDMRNRGLLGALPIKGVDRESGSLVAVDGTTLREYGTPGSGRWVREGDLGDGSIKYLGSATHAGHIELKALWVMYDGTWFNIITLLPE